MSTDWDSSDLDDEEGSKPNATGYYRKWKLAGTSLREKMSHMRDLQQQEVDEISSIVALLALNKGEWVVSDGDIYSEESRIIDAYNKHLAALNDILRRKIEAAEH